MQGIGVLIFWYRNQLYAIENRCGWTRLALAEDRVWLRGQRPGSRSLGTDLMPSPCRSPAEGAYSEGFANAKFTQVSPVRPHRTGYALQPCQALLFPLQDYGIECPSTKSVFSLKTGEIIDW